MRPGAGIAARRLPVEPAGRLALAYWGVVALLAIEANLFAYLTVSHLYLRSSAASWPPAGVEPPEPLLPGVGLALLAASSACVYVAETARRAGGQGRVAAGFGAAFLLGGAFLWLALAHYLPGGPAPQSHAYGAIVFTTVAYQAVHVLAALLMNGVVLARVWLGRLDPTRHAAVQSVALFWHFVVAMWVVAFLTLYVSPRLASG